MNDFAVAHVTANPTAHESDFEFDGGQKGTATRW
jgi:hypothetical protein